MPGLQGESSFTGSGGLSVDIRGAGNLNGKAVIDGSFSSGERNDDTDEDIQNDSDQEIETSNTGKRNDFGRGLMENNVGLESPELGNINSQSAIYQYGTSNSNKQGDIMQQAFRRQNNSINQEPKKHIICGYLYKTLYPNIQQQNLYVESDIVEPSWRNAYEQSLVGQYGMRRFYSGPFNHLL